ncbi:5'-adenylylsulfate reductase-like 5 [Eucalyptus grandis]|uniref:5'-adenylylsulfate reductase-like 5 n=1 Tax=Eucalyptus grandis TaxID=71139 RepID=UPI000527CF3F|nr:5'-adenylylsulfate reductase-like 5 [Eucalyptus grandis]
MAPPSSLASLLLICMSAFAGLALFAATAAEPRHACPVEPFPFLYRLTSRCSTSIPPSLPLQVDGYFLDSIVASKDKNACVALLLYASWCPFSQRLLPIFDVLSSMFPQMDHLLVEHSSVFPSVLSRYGIHSVPSILVINQTSMVKYHGPKTLLSLVRFYERNTGFEPVLDFMEGQLTGLSSSKESSSTSWIRNSGTSMKEMIMKDPYLSLSVLFLCLRVLMVGFSEYLRVLHRIDVRRAWRKLRLCKNGNFHVGARDAQVWASSLASVSNR